MNDKMYNCYEEDREIDLIDLLFYVLKEWRKLILAIVVGAILGAGLFFVKNKKEDTVDINTQAKMDIAYENRQMYNKQLEYNNNSIIMKLDPNGYYSGVLKYYVSADKNTGVISELYKNIVNDEDVLNSLKEASGFDCDTTYISEIIYSYTSWDNDLFNINNEGESDNVQKHAFVGYDVVSNSQESCEKMLEVLSTKVLELQKEYQKTYGSYEATEVSSVVNKTVNSDYISTQKDNLKKLDDYLTTMETAENALSDDEKILYVEKYSDSADYEDIKEMLLEDVKQSSGKKYFAIGIVLMVFLWAVYYAMKYILDSSIKTASELQSTYHLPIIGRVRLDENTAKGLDKKISDWKRKVNAKADTVDYIAQVIKNLGYEKLALCGSTENAEVSNLMNNVSKTCKQVKIGNFISESAESLDYAKEAGKELLVVQVGKNNRKEIERELESCRLQNIDVVGVIAIEKM